MTDNGARALAERLVVHDLMGDGECARNPDAHRMCLAQAAAILANGAVFLADGSPPQGLGPYYRKQIAEQAAELDRLRTENEQLRYAVKLLQDNWAKTIPAPMDRAALQPEGSAGTHEHNWQRGYGVRPYCHDCGAEEPGATEGSAGTACDETKAAASDHYERWETFGHVCTGRHYEPGHQCVCGAMWAAEGSARDG